MNGSIISLYEYLYSMELYRTKFIDDSKLIDCMVNLTGIYHKVHQSGMLVGPVDFNRIEIKLDDGSIRLPQRMRLDQFLRIIDLIKYAPPEINAGIKEWNTYSDLYCLSVLLFIIRYSYFPFDGMLVNKRPIVSIEHAHEVYNNPIFIFDVLDTTNKLCSECNSHIISVWNNEKNIELKDLFIRAFSDGLNNEDIRVNCSQWLGALGIGGGMV